VIQPVTFANLAVIDEESRKTGNKSNGNKALDMKRLTWYHGSATCGVTNCVSHVSVAVKSTTVVSIFARGLCMYAWIAWKYSTEMSISGCVILEKPSLCGAIEQP
jgi:hypothetical protein